MKVYDSILSRRSIRRFAQQPIPRKTIEKMVNAARLAPSAANLQPVEYIVVDDKETCNQLFQTLGWAGYLKPSWSPSQEEHPTAYIVLLIRNEKNAYALRDVSLAAANIVLTAEEEQVGSCILCKIDKQKIKKILNVPDNRLVDSVIALGYKAEQPVIEDLTGSVKYWRDDHGILHVPKRSLKEVLHINIY